MIGKEVKCCFLATIDVAHLLCWVVLVSLQLVADISIF
jgi:hypothetical protein